jgi:hypothetical protein
MNATETMGKRPPIAPATPTPTRLSVVIETVTCEEYLAHGHEVGGPTATIEALRRQECSGPIEILLVARATADSVDQRLAHLPNFRIVIVDADATYYEMKNAGGCAATTDYVAFIDADCIPSPHWAETAVTALDAGADVVAGRTRYTGPGRWAQAMSFFDFGQVGRRPDGSATQFLLSNAAFRVDVFRSHQVDTRGHRSGGCYMTTQRLRADNHYLAYVPQMTVTHGNDYRVAMGLAKRLRNGHDAAALRRLDETRLLPYRWITRLGPLGAPLVAGKRIWDDWVRLWRRHAELDISVKELPVVALLSIPLRIVEGGAYALSTVRPSVIGKYWG